ncbi:MAG: ammonium transporter family protein, partial [Fibrobacter sp.]|nr:ammonium transporter family protein [Fibrobacter sp.]
TIVSGAMAERTKFSSYLIYSCIINAIVYPIEAGWVWNAQGWLCKLGFIDFAGSAAIHMVGGISALIGAVTLGPRIGKYSRGKDGQIETKAIPGHSLTLGALGCFILWFGWYGFNGAAATSVAQLASIFVTTTIAPAIAACVTMCFTWIKNGKPDVSMTLNGALAGLVGITAGCANLDAAGAIGVGVVAGILVVLVVEFIDIKLHIDDPVGAVAVHCANGIWGTLAVGLFHTDMGLFYGGGCKLLWIQFLGVLAIGLWTTVCMLVTFLIVKKTFGLRVSAEEEVGGLDIHEHGLASSYADFMPIAPQVMLTSQKDTPVIPNVIDSEIPMVREVTTPLKMTKVVILTRQNKFEQLRTALDKLGITGMTVTQVLGYGMQKGRLEYYRGAPVDTVLLPKIKIEIVVSKIPVNDLVDYIKKILYTGHAGDGKIFVYDVKNVIKVRTGEQGYEALQDFE